MRSKGKEASGAVFQPWMRQLPTRQRAAARQLSPVVEELARDEGIGAAGDLMVKLLESVLAKQTKPKPRTGLTMALLRGRVAREQLKEEEGGSCSADEAATLLGMSKPGVLKRYHQGQLLGWREAKQRAVRLPVWQFDQQGVLPGIEDALKVLNEAPWMDDWGRILFFLNRRRSLDGKRPLDLLRKGKTGKVASMAQAEVE